MTQRANDYPFNPNVTSGTELSVLLNTDQNAELTKHSGGIRPVYVQEGTEWMDTSNGLSDYRIYLYDGTVDVLMGTLDTVLHTWTPAGGSVGGSGLPTDGTGSMSGNLVVGYANPVILMNTTAAGQSANFNFFDNGALSWTISKTAVNNLEFEDSSGVALSIGLIATWGRSVSIDADNATQIINATIGNPSQRYRAAGVDRAAIYAAGTTFKIDGYNVAGDVVVSGLDMGADGDITLRSDAHNKSAAITSNGLIFDGGRTTAGVVSDGVDVGAILGTITPDVKVSQIQLWQPTGDLTVNQPLDDGGLEVYFEPASDGELIEGTGMALIGVGTYISGFKYILNVRRFAASKSVMQLIGVG